MKKLFCFLIMCLCLISGCSCSKDEISRTSIVSSQVKAYINKDDDSYIYVDPFGTYISLVGYNEKKVYALENEFKDLVIKYHSLLDRNYYYRDSDGNLINNIKVINDSYGSGNSVSVDDIIIEILKEGIKYTKLSNGKFNIFSGTITDVWDGRFDYFNPLYRVDPSEEEVNNAMKCVLKYDKIDEFFIIDEINKTITFNKFDGCDNGASITLGALAKSYFLDKISELDNFKKMGAGIYDAGQSSIIIKGKNPTRSSGEFLVAVKDSLNGGNAVQLKIDSDSSISTSSGDNKGYINSDGIRRIHILDATSGYSSTNLLAVTVIGSKAMIMDIVTTSVMAMSDDDEIKAYLTKLKENDIDLKILLQKEENNNLKIYANESMKNSLGTIYVSVNVEDFNYGA